MHSYTHIETKGLDHVRCSSPPPRDRLRGIPRQKHPRGKWGHARGTYVNPKGLYVSKQRGYVCQNKGVGGRTTCVAPPPQPSTASGESPCRNTPGGGGGTRALSDPPCTAPPR